VQIVIFDAFNNKSVHFVGVIIVGNYYFHNIQVDGTKYHGTKFISKTRLTRCNTHEVYKGEFIFFQHDTTQCLTFVVKPVT
jgi:hypothetical protein